jgi:hypothetical protein
MKNFTTSDRPSCGSAATSTKLSWPEGATAGILIVAAACVGVSATVYHIAGPRDVFAQEALGGR